MGIREKIHQRLFYEKMGYKTDGKEKLIEKYSVSEIRYCKKI